MVVLVGADRIDSLSFVEGRAEAGDVRESVRVPSCHGGCHGSNLALYSYGGPPVNVPCVSLGGIGHTPARLAVGEAVTSLVQWVLIILVNKGKRLF